MSEGRRINMAAPRTMSEVVRELRHSEQVGDEAAVSRLRAELRAVADRASHLEEGGKR